MEINLYLLEFCGLFDFNQEQSEKLINNKFFRLEKILKKTDPTTWNYLHDQYYPFFRYFMTNEGSDKILTSTSELLPGKYQKVVDAGKTEFKIIFSIRQAEIFLFNAAPGIVTLDIEIHAKDLTLHQIAAFVNSTRTYNSIVTNLETGTEYKIIDLIQNDILNRAAGGGCFDLDEDSKVLNYRGSKLKVFQGIDLVDKQGRDLSEILFELGTISPIGSTEEDNDYNYNAHSKSYYKEIIKNAVNVYNNWTALCLFDTFTVVGHNYLGHGHTLKTWKENYFKIYIYNLYFKYHLFAINGEGLHVKKRLKKQRANFHEFMRIYDNDHISYNFLPNMIHNNIRQGLQTQKETKALRSKIELINGIITESSSKMTNWILFGLAIVALIPSNWHDLFASENKDGVDLQVPYTPNIVILSFKFLIILSILIYNLIVSGRIRAFFKRSA